MSSSPLALEDVNTPRNKAVSQLRRMITESRFGIGDVLPSERTLAGHLDVHRNTLRRALQFLNDEGVIRRAGSGGWVVADSGTGGSGGSGLSQTIGVLTTVSPQQASSAPGGNDYAIDRGVFSAIQRSGRHALLLSPARLVDAADVEEFGRQRMAGLVATQEVTADPAGVELLHRFADAGVAIACHGDDAGVQRFDRIYSDHAAGCDALVRWLAARGRRRILRVWTGATDRYWVRGRDAGYAAATAALGLAPLAPAIVTGLPRRPFSPDAPALEQRARHLAGHLVDRLRGPDAVDAILLFTDYDAFPAAAAVKLCGAEPGRDVLIAGYDNVARQCWESAVMPGVPHATIEKHNETAGDRLVQLLLDRVTGKLPAEPQAVVDRPELVALGG